MADYGRLCYVDGNRAFFTTREPFTEQWGDDWNDAPFDCNAGDPYTWSGRPHRDGTIDPEYDVYLVYWAGPFQMPDAYGNRGGYVSVQDINEGRAGPWLTTPEQWVQLEDGDWGYSDEGCTTIGAGLSYEEFKRIVEGQGGAVSAPHLESRR